MRGKPFSSTKFSSCKADGEGSGSILHSEEMLLGGKSELWSFSSTLDGFLWQMCLIHKQNEGTTPKMNCSQQ